MESIILFLPILLVTDIINLCHAFTIITPLVGTRTYNKNNRSCSAATNLILTSPQQTTTILHSSSSSFTNPTQEQSVELGIREWPQQTISKKSWEESIQENETFTRYILQGKGEIVITDDSTLTRTITRKESFEPGLLIEVTGPATLKWKKEPKSSENVIILTPGYEQGGLLLGVGLSFIILCGALIAGVGN